MASIIKKLIFIFFTNILFAQNINSMDNFISFSYDKSYYNKIAVDSIKSLYDKQYKKYFNGDIFPSVKKHAISLNYKFEDLSYFTIPRYRLYQDGFLEYNCKNNIEEFIAFEEYNKYQFTLVKHENNVLCKIQIPNDMFEMERVENPRLIRFIDSSEYNRNYIESLSSYSEIYNPKYDNIINNKDNNFFFEIYGLRRVLFEIESKTGLLYANFSSYEYGDPLNTEDRMLANDFIRKYVGEKVIKEICRGHYLEVDELILNEGYNPCVDLNVNNKKIYLKVIRK